MNDRAGAGVIQRFLAFSRWLAQPDKLPEVDTPSRPPRTKVSIVAWLTVPDSLPMAPTDPVQRKFSLTWLLAPEQLPNQARPEQRATVPFFRWLFGHDTTLPTSVGSPKKEGS